MFTNEEKRIRKEKYYNRGRGPDQRRVDPGKKKSWQAQELWDIHKEIARRLILGWKGVRIAEELGCTPQTVSNVRNSPVVREHMAMLNGTRDAEVIDIADDIKKFAPKCVSLLKDVVEGNEEGVDIKLKVKVAGDLLDRGGHSAIRRVEAKGHMIGSYMSAEDLQKIIETAKSRKAVGRITDGSVVEADYEEVT